MIRKIVAVVLGLIAGSVFNMALVKLSHAVYPPPEGIDLNDIEVFQDYVKTHGMPTGAWMIVLAAHTGGSLVSGFVCGIVAKRSWYLAAAILGILWMCGGIAMLFVLPAPYWFAVADVLLYVPAALVGVKLGGALTGTKSPPVTA